jgi:hypothetical protein
VVRGTRYQGGREETIGPPWLKSRLYFNVVRHIVVVKYAASLCIEVL